MLQKLYISNYRCLQNFEFIPDHDSTLFIGKNGSGKSTIGSVLNILRAIGQGETSVDTLLQKEDFSFFNTNLPIRFEITAKLGNIVFKYELVFDFPPRFKMPRIYEENLISDVRTFFTRKLGEINFWPRQNRDPVSFHVDWHKAALPQIGDPDRDKELENFRNWLAQIMVIDPIRHGATSESHAESQYLERNCANFAEYLRWLLNEHPETYSKIIEYLRLYMPDLESFQNRTFSRTTKELILTFRNPKERLELDFNFLSDGEKCLLVAGTVTAAIPYLSGSLVFWDEPDCYISLWDLAKVISMVRQSFQENGQVIATSQSPGAIRCFSPESTYLLSRANHLEPTRIQSLRDLVKNEEDVVDVIEANMLG